VARYVQALRKAKMPVGLYYSPRDWWWKANRAELIGPKETKEQLPAYVAAHLKELSNRYGPIDIFWFDGGVGQEAAMYKEILGPLNPRGITNDRNGPGDYITPEGQIPIRPLVNPDGSDAIWESCIPMGNGGWSYRHDGAEAYDVLIHQMVEVFAKGGNLLRNIGPKPTGEWSGPVRERIQQIGAWLKVNGASVYGTHRTRLGAQPWGWATANDTTLYLHVFTWPKDGVLTVTGLHDRVTGVRLLTAGTRLQYQHNGNTLTITLPAEAPDPVDTVIAVRVKR
jgi:alpha-L-fucosidase